MNHRDKLHHAPCARAAYDHFIYEHKRARRLDSVAFLLTIGALVGFAALPFILFYTDLLP
jgi:hypothetical protein